MLVLRLGAVAATAFMVLPACSADLAPTSGPDAAPVPGDAAATRVTTTRDADGVYTTRVDATSTTAWTTVDFATGGEAEPYDLAAQRFHLALGASRGVAIAPVEATSLAEVTELAADGWRTDADLDGDGAIDYAFEQGDGWYSYDPATHVLAPRPLVWLLRWPEGTAIKLQIASYYDAAGTAGVFTLRWAPLAGGAHVVR